MLWALCEDAVSEGVCAPIRWAFGLLNNTAEKSSPGVMVPLGRGQPAGGQS